MGSFGRWEKDPPKLSKTLFYLDIKLAILYLIGAGKDDMLPAVEAYRARRESFGSELTYNETVKLLSFGRRGTTVNELADEDGITRASLRESKAGHAGATFCTGLHPTRYTGHICGDAKKARGDHEPGCFDPAGVRRGARG